MSIAKLSLNCSHSIGISTIIVNNSHIVKSFLRLLSMLLVAGMGGGEASLCSWSGVLLLSKDEGSGTVERLLLLHLYHEQEGELVQILGAWWGM